MDLNDFLVSSENISFAIAAGVVSVRNIEFVINFLNKEVKWFLKDYIFLSQFRTNTSKIFIKCCSTCTGSDIDLFFSY